MRRLCGKELEDDRANKLGFNCFFVSILQTIVKTIKGSTVGCIHHPTKQQIHFVPVSLHLVWSSYDANVNESSRSIFLVRVNGGLEKKDDVDYELLRCMGLGSFRT